MKVFGIPVQDLSVLPSPGVRIILREQLREWDGAYRWLSLVRCRGAQLLRRARQRRDACYGAMQTRLAEMQHQRDLEVVQNTETRCQEAIAQAIRWMVEEAQLETVVYQKLVTTAKGWLLEALQDFSHTIAWDRLLVERLSAHLASLPPDQAITLKTDPQHVARVSQKFSDNRLITVVGDRTLSGSEAILETSLMRIAFDLKVEWENLTSLLTTP